MPDEEMEKELTSSYILGQSAGLKEAAIYMMREAQKYFISGKNDKLANHFRRISQIFDAQSEARHPRGEANDEN